MSGFKFLVVLSTIMGILGGFIGVKKAGVSEGKEKLLLFLIVGTIVLMFTVIAGAFILVYSPNPNALMW